MSSYVRPLIEAPVFRDADGAVINYGSRWHGSPPEDTYSVDTHPERFAPLHVVADALIAHLRETYDVEVDEGVEVAADLLRPAFHDVVRAVRIRPNDPKCASLTLVFTAYPGIYMHAGLLHDFHYPVCGCDACDSNWRPKPMNSSSKCSRPSAATTERRSNADFAPGSITPSPIPTARAPGNPAPSLSAQRLKDAKPVLRDLPVGWNHWPRPAPPLDQHGLARR